MRLRLPLAGAILIQISASTAGFAQDIRVSIPRETAAAITREAALPALASQVELLRATEFATGEDVISVPMRDGVELSASIIRPKSAPPAAKLPVLLVKSPYRDNWNGLIGDVARQALQRGYAVVLVHDRGQQWSRGSYSWLRGANNDNWDILDWIQKQSWSNARVGTIGCSSSSEWMLSFGTKGHPALKAMVPMGAATGVGDVPGYSDKGIFYAGGVPQLFWGWWFNLFGYEAHPEMPAGLSADQRRRIAASFSPEPLLSLNPAVAQTLPSAEILKKAGSPRTIFDQMITWEPGDPRWQQFDFYREGQAIKVPALHIDSWYDLVEAYPTTKFYEHASRLSENQYLIMGGSVHCQQGSETDATQIGDRSIGDARFDWAGEIARFLDHFVKNGNTAYQPPKVRYYLMGDKWRSSPAWPIEGAVKQRFYLSSKGYANSMLGDGRLLENSDAERKVDSFHSDPSAPVPSKAASCCDPNAAQDQREIELRSDVLVYTSEPQASDLDLAGYISANLYVMSSVKDADLALKLVDVAPDGKALNIVDTIKRLRYRNGVASPELMGESQVYNIAFTQAVTALRIKAGHRLRIEIAGSNFPAYERNMQTGGQNALAKEGVAGKISIFHGPGVPSFIEVTKLP